VFFTGYNKDGIWRFFPFFRKKALILLVFYYLNQSAGAPAKPGADACSFGKFFRTILM